MHIIEMQLHNFFVNQSYPYRQGDVEIIYHEKDSSITISSGVPNYEVKEGELALTLQCSYENLFDFAADFLITSSEDIEKVTAEVMYKMFLLGRCGLYIDLDNNLESYLIFKRRREVYVAESDEQPQHEVPPQINIIEDLIIYTRHYYEKLYA